MTTQKKITWCAKSQSASVSQLSARISKHCHRVRLCADTEAGAGLIFRAGCHFGWRLTGFNRRAI